jgi:hypothetical protein
MPYRDNVAALTQRLRVPNPIPEEVLDIGRILFWDSSGNATEIRPTDMNRAGRLFLQHLARDMCQLFYPPSFDWSAECSERAADFFDENWGDAEAKGRRMLMAMKTAIRVEIEWK